MKMLTWASNATKSFIIRSNNHNNLLLDATAQLIATLGIRGTTMRGIAHTTGMLRGSIYDRSLSRGPLLLTVCRSGVAQIVSAFEVGNLGR